MFAPRAWGAKNPPSAGSPVVLFVFSQTDTGILGEMPKKSVWCFLVGIFYFVFPGATGILGEMANKKGWRVFLRVGTPFLGGRGERRTARFGGVPKNRHIHTLPKLRDTYYKWKSREKQ